MKLRFKDENGNNYPDWEEKRLGDTADFLSGLKGKSKEDFFKGSNAQYIQFKQIFNSKVLEKNLGEVEVNESEIQNIVQKNDLIMNMTSESIEEIGTIAINELNIENLYLNSFSNILRTKERFNAYFMKYKMSTTSVRLKIQKEGQGITRINLANSRIIELKLNIPQSLEEQEKIGSFFKLQDEVIELKEKLIKEKREYKKGLLQKVFNQELRFKDENGNDYPDWEEKKIEEIGLVVSGGTPKTEIPEYWEGQYNWYTPTEIISKYNRSSSIKNITALGLKKSSSKLLPVGSILLTTRATIGNKMILEKEACTNQGFQNIIPNKGTSSEYIYYALDLMNDHFNKVAIGTTFKEVSKVEVSKSILPIPKSLEEQEKIGNLFKVIDEEIELLENEVIKLKQKKKYYLSVMM